MPGSITHRPEWKALAEHQHKIAQMPMRDILMQETGRFDKMSVQDNGFLLDYSRYPATAETMGLLCELARAVGLEGWRERLFAGDTINNTEDRPVLHTALRAPADETVLLDGADIMPDIRRTLDRMRDISDRLRSGEWLGYTGKPIRDIIHIGIGGSDLGPRMACAALAHLSPAPITIHFVSNVDGAQIDAALHQCEPDSTLVIIASKTFTTSETMLNARTAKSWLLAGMPEADLGAHLIGLTSNVKLAKEFGITEDNALPMAEGVGGRYSLWSSIGLSVCITAGFDTFQAMLDGAQTMDIHFRSAPLEHNIPVIMGLLGVWQRNFFNAPGLAVIPYDARLAYLPAYMQQLDMESNGKTADRHGHLIADYVTGPMIFGVPGTDSQHSFFQWLHQGRDTLPIDLIGVCNPDHPYAAHHDMLLFNMAAQAQAFAHGRVTEQTHRYFPGNRPVNCIILDRLDGFHLGQLIAAYEHKVFVQGIVWNINSFDQFGVELGKELANTIAKKDMALVDPATQSLLSYVQARRTKP